MAESIERSQAPSALTGLNAELRTELEALKSVNRLRTLRVGTQSQGVDFSSNDYLGLSKHPALQAAAERATREYGSGSGASRLLCSGLPAHEQLEQLGAEWLQAEASLFFPTGYQANLGLLGALLRRGDALFSDQLNHASIIDGARLARARVSVYPHLDLERLEAELVLRRDARRRLVITESVFSMDGDLAPLVELDQICARHNAWLIVDEAHAAGLLGADGAGACAALDHNFERLYARLITGGKALGTAGALVAGSRELRELLINRARSFIFSTAPPPAQAASFAAAIRLIRQSSEERERPIQLARSFAETLGLPEPAAAIVPFPVASEERALALQSQLNAAGLDVRAIRPPTVPVGTSRLRIVFHASNRDSEVDELARHLQPQVRETAARTPRHAPTLFVTGTDTDIGKTVVSALLTRAAARRGGARYWKPVQTGSDSDTDEVARLAEIEPAWLLPPAFHFSEPASPHTAARADGREIPIGALQASLSGIRRTLCDDQLIVELAGGLLVPLRDRWTQLDWLEELAPPLVLVARSGLGTLNHTLLSLEALRKRHLEPRALFLVGEPHAANRRTLQELGKPLQLFEVPPFAKLCAQELDHWLDNHSLESLFS